MLSYGLNDRVCVFGGAVMDEAEKRYYTARQIITDKNLFRNIEFFLNRFQVSQTARLCRITVDKDLPNQQGVIRQEKLSIQASGSNFEIILRDLVFKVVSEGDYWVGDMDFTHDGLTVLKGVVLKERENLTPRYVPPYRLRSDINKLDAYDWIDRFDELVKRMLLLERDKENFRTQSAIKAQAQAIDLSKYPLEADFAPVETAQEEEVVVDDAASGHPETAADPVPEAAGDDPVIILPDEGSSDGEEGPHARDPDESDRLAETADAAALEPV